MPMLGVVDKDPDRVCLVGSTGGSGRHASKLFSSGVAAVPSVISYKKIHILKKGCTWFPGVLLSQCADHDAIPWIER